MSVINTNNPWSDYAFPSLSQCHAVVQSLCRMAKRFPVHTHHGAWVDMAKTLFPGLTFGKFRADAMVLVDWARTCNFQTSWKSGERLSQIALIEFLLTLEAEKGLRLRGEEVCKRSARNSTEWANQNFMKNAEAGRVGRKQAFLMTLGFWGIDDFSGITVPEDDPVDTSGTPTGIRGPAKRAFAEEQARSQRAEAEAERNRLEAERLRQAASEQREADHRREIERLRAEADRAKETHRHQGPDFREMLEIFRMGQMSQPQPQAQPQAQPQNDELKMIMLEILKELRNSRGGDKGTV